MEGYNILLCCFVSFMLRQNVVLAVLWPGLNIPASHGVGLLFDSSSELKFDLNSQYINCSGISSYSEIVAAANEGQSSFFSYLYFRKLICRIQFRKMTWRDLFAILRP
jgi:hypothetical protein